MSPFTFKIGGEAGYGIMSAGLAFSKIATRSGYFIYDYTEYPSIIRGGHNVMQTTVSDQPVHSQYQSTNLLVALNQETVDRHALELVEGGGVLYDADKKINITKVPNSAHLLAVPFDRFAREHGGTILMRNTVALGAVMALLGADIEILKALIAEEFAAKDPDITKKNYATAQAGYEYVLDHFPNNIQPILKPLEESKLPVVVNANEAVSMGAIAAGMQFASIYPMTPTSNILHFLAAHDREYGYVYKQPEDEISAINMAIGASFAGARAMVATAGGGFCLMTEGYGLAGITETPLVIIEGMRPGPATGLPTWTGQGDLQFLLHAHQDDFPRIVLAAGDVTEAFDLIMQAFNLADKYQTPVVILLDKQLCESHESVTPFNTSHYEIDRGKMVLKKKRDFERYALAEDGISPRSIPGVDNHFVANSDEHDANGYSHEGAKNRIEQMEKRMQKLITCREKDMAEPTLYGPKDAPITVVSWGSNKGAILEALKDLPQVNYLHLTWVNPFPAETVKKILMNSKQIINVECNYTGQMSNWIKQQTGIEIKHNLLKYDGRPFYPEELVEKIKGLMV